MKEHLVDEVNTRLFYMYSLVVLLSGIYPFLAMLALLVTIIVKKPQKSEPAMELHSTKCGGTSLCQRS